MSTLQTSFSLIRRGNALILVVGVLVLLVLVATAFIIRTQSGRFCYCCPARCCRDK